MHLHGLVREAFRILSLEFWGALLIMDTCYSILVTGWFRAVDYRQTGGDQDKRMTRCVARDSSASQAPDGRQDGLRSYSRMS